MQLRRAGEVLGALSRGSDYDSFFDRMGTSCGC